VALPDAFRCTRQSRCVSRQNRPPLVVAIMTAGRGRGALKALLTPFVAAFDSLLGAVSGDIGRCLLVAARCDLLTSMCRVKNDHLIAGSALGGDVARLLKCALEKIIMFALPQALRAAFG
jgi:hypothetical protein